MAHVTVINEYQHVQQIVSGHHHVTADETVGGGGSGAGLAPRELLLASLGTCTAIALRKYAVKSDWALGKITVGLRWSTRDADGREHVDRRLSFAKPLAEDQKRRLLEVVADTPITELLRPTVTIESSVAD